jgi:signal transduction histidine kinase
MRVLYIISWVIFFTGLVFKFLHIIGENIFLILACLMMLIHSIIFLCKRIKTDYKRVLLYFSYTFLTIYITARVCYWNGSKLLFLLALLVVIFTFVMYLIEKKAFKIPQIILVSYFVFFLMLSYTPSYKIHYIVNLNIILNKERRNTDYLSWDKYSWFLHLRELEHEALEANQKARKAAELCVGKLIPENEFQKYIEKLDKHEFLIKTKNIDWNEWFLD